MGRPSHGSTGHEALSSSFQARSPLAEALLARDIAACSDDERDDDTVNGDDFLLPPNSNGSPRRYRRVSASSHPSVNPEDEQDFSPLQAAKSPKDGYLPPPEESGSGSGSSWWTRAYENLFSTTPSSTPLGPDVERQPPTEVSPLLGQRGEDEAITRVASRDPAWEEALATGPETTWQKEAWTIISYTIPLVGTFMLGYSLNVTSVFAVGKIGKNELGAVSCE